MPSHNALHGNPMLALRYLQQEKPRKSRPPNPRLTGKRLGRGYYISLSPVELEIIFIITPPFSLDPGEILKLEFFGISGHRPIRTFCHLQRCHPVRMQFIREMFSHSGSRGMHVDYFKTVFLCNLPNARDYTMNYNAIFNRTFSI